MRLFAISDLHVGHSQNREALLAMPPHPDDWLIVAGDVGETVGHMQLALDTLQNKFARLLWVPGNHELWTVPDERLRGEDKYHRLVALCRERGVLTPEDEYAVWPGPGGPHVIALLFLLYDYSFRPESVPLEGAVAWAEQSGVVCADEHVLHPDPYPSRIAWCEERCRVSEERLGAMAAQGLPAVLVNHFPLRAELAYLPMIPRFSLWCGTRRSAQWHQRFGAKVVVFGHLHMRRTTWIDGVRFEEVSFGYPRQWSPSRGVTGYLREILPGPPARS